MLDKNPIRINKQSSKIKTTEPRKLRIVRDWKTHTREELLSIIAPLIPEAPKTASKRETKKMIKDYIEQSVKTPPSIDFEIKETDLWTEIFINGKKHIIPKAVYWPKLRNLQQMGDVSFSTNPANWQSLVFRDWYWQNEEVAPTPTTPTLQQVTDEGNTTTNDILVDAKITAKTLWVQVSNPLTAVHLASTTGATINNVIAGSISLVDAFDLDTPIALWTAIAEPTAWSGGSGNLSDTWGDENFFADNKAYTARVYPCLDALWTIYRSQFYEEITFTDPNDSQWYQYLNFNWWTVTISGESVQYFIEIDINGGGFSPISVTSGTSIQLTNTSGSNTTNPWGSFYVLSAGTAPTPYDSGTSTFINGGSGGITQINSTVYVETDSVTNIWGTNYCSWSPTTSSFDDSSAGGNYDIETNWNNPWGSQDNSIIRVSMDSGTSWYYYYTSSTTWPFTITSLSNDTDAEARWWQIYTASTDFNFDMVWRALSPSGSNYYSPTADSYTVTISDSQRYIIKHTYSAVTNAKILAPTGSIGYGKNINTTYYDIWYTSWWDGTAQTPTTIWFTGTAQNRDYRAYWFNGTIYSQVPLTLSVTNLWGFKYVSGSVAYPSGITQIKILRQINWGGYTASKNLSSPTTTFTDDVTDNWSGNVVITPNAIIPSTLRLDKEISALNSSNPFQLQVVATWAWSPKYSGLAFWVADNSSTEATFQSYLYSESTTGYVNLVAWRLNFLSSLWGAVWARISGWWDAAFNVNRSGSQHFQVSGQNDIWLINTRSDQDSVWIWQTLWTDEQATLVVQPNRSFDVSTVYKGHSGMSDSSVAIRFQDSSWSFKWEITQGGWWRGATGSTGTPALSCRSYTNTGIIFPLAGTLADVTWGVERTRLDSSGRFWVANTTLTAYIDAPASTTSIPSFRIRAGTAPTTPNEWDVWNNSTVKWMAMFVDGISGFIPRTLFTQTASVAVANSTTETTITGSGTGTLTLPTNFFTVGKQIRIRCFWFQSSLGSPNITVRVKLGGTTIMSTTAVAAGNGTNDWFLIEWDITCRTTGSSWTLIWQWVYQELFQNGRLKGLTSTSTTTVNTTITQALTVTVQWWTATVNNTITCTNLSLESLN